MVRGAEDGYFAIMYVSEDQCRCPTRSRLGAKLARGPAACALSTQRPEEIADGSSETRAWHAGVRLSCAKETSLC